MNDSYSRQVAVFKAFCDENRWKILDLLTSGEKCACVLLNKLEISQSTLSHHMKILCDSGIVIGRKEGKWTHYSLSSQGVQAAVDLLQPLASPLHGSVPCTCTPSLQRGDDSMEQKTQLYVLTGFLGSGATTERNCSSFSADTSPSKLRKRVLGLVSSELVVSSLSAH